MFLRLPSQLLSHLYSSDSCRNLKVRIHPHVKVLNCSFHPLENNVNYVKVLL